METRIKLGIARCLLGDKVRYDGRHKRDAYLTGTLGPHVEWVPVCPEHECGLPIPREAMNLMGNLDHPRLITVDTRIDHTQRMQQWTAAKLDELARQDLCGYVFKTKSPSSGMRNIDIYHEDGVTLNGKGVGLFARAFMDRFPTLPVEDEARLGDPDVRDNFIQRIFVYQRWRHLTQIDFNLKGLLQFHTRHKLIIMAHDPQAVSALGRLVAQEDDRPLAHRAEAYLALLMETLKRPATIKKNVNVLQHIQGYFKKQLQAPEKQYLIRIIEAYHQGLVPLIVPVTLLNDQSQKWNEPYLKNQFYLHPHPLELRLRYHA